MKALVTFKQLNATFRQRVLLPISLWLTLERGTALVLMLYGLTLLSPNGTAFHVLARLLNFKELPLAAGMVVAICAMVLLSGNLTALVYHLAILPLLVYAGMAAWAAGTEQRYVNGAPYTWALAVFLFGVWTAFYIAGVKLPAFGGDHERTAE
jgi:hypothetical protein